MTSSKVTFHFIPAKDCLPIRQRVLWPQHSLNDNAIPEDVNGYHFGAFIKNHLIGCASLFHQNEHEIRLRKFAILPEYQGQGIGSHMFSMLLNFAKEKRYTTFFFGARQSATAFYNKHGCVSYGETFYKENLPYIHMKYML